MQEEKYGLKLKQVKAQAFLLCCLLFSAFSFAQENNLHCKNFSNAKTYLLDSLSIAEESIICSDTNLFYVFDPATKQITFEHKTDSVEICYRRFQVNFSDTLLLYERNDTSNQVIFQKKIVRPTSSKETIWETPNLTKSGNISRGISVGNTQSVFVNSNLNLQLEGMLADDVEVKAIISDQNIPVQPEGNTQQIQDFDRVYIQVNTPKIEVLAGDVLFQKEQGTFLKYRRNVQGAESTFSQKGKYSVQGGVALSKGKFTSQQLEALDNVQGPYRLLGPNQERFIIVLAGSEKVYLDGKLLERGWDKDYTIDYNLAELNFTNRVVITRYSRLRVDFEYADRNYVRLNQFASLSYHSSSVDIVYDYYAENDNENRPLNLSLSSTDQLYLSQIGDDISRAYVEMYDSVGFRPNAILYTRDTVNEDGTDLLIFQYAAEDIGESVYEVIFSEVPTNEGDYQKGEVLGNGTIYEWVGKGKGNYLPVRIINTPQQKSMHRVLGHWNFHPKHKIYGEFALSQYDQNLYSDLGDNNNLGNAWEVGYEWTDSVGNYQTKLRMEQQGVHQNFVGIDRYRGVDFDRDWGATSLEQTTYLNYSQGQFSLQKNRMNRLSYQFGYRAQDSVLKGIQHRVLLNKQLGKVQTENEYFYTQSDRDSLQTNWQKINTKWSYTNWKFVPSIRYNQERNPIRNIEQDVFLKPQLYLDTWEVKLASKDTSQNSFDIAYLYQISKDTLQDKLVNNEEIQQLQANWKHYFSKKQKVQLFTTYRLSNPLIENNTTTATDELNENLMGRADWTASWFQNIFNTYFLYQTQAGRVLRREYLYTEVPLGQGTHIFKDFNENGVRELNEFVEDPLVGNFVRTYVPTNEYINAFESLMRYKVTVRFPRKWNQNKGIKGVLSRFSLLSTGLFQQKITDNSFSNRFNPWSSVNTEFLLNQKQQFNNTLFFNKLNKYYGMTLSHQQSTRRQLLTFGVDSSAVETWRLNTRVRLSKSFNTQIEGVTKVQEQQNNYAQGISYSLQSYTLHPALNYQVSTFSRLTGFMEYTTKENTWGIEKSDFWEYGLSGSWAKSNVQRIDAQLSILRVFSTEESNNTSPLSFLILEGLQEGINWRWRLNWSRKIAQGLQLQLEYEGRKPNDQRIVHLGSVQLSALF
ncbi:MAG: hypothetical protein GY827_06105 [Cytophagales bacterium]|nr:hypothetical protein [Cytophagales bacterium]